MIPKRLLKYRLPPGKPRATRPEHWWGVRTSFGRETCLKCLGDGLHRGRECRNCDGEGYRWPDATVSA